MYEVCMELLRVEAKLIWRIRIVTSLNKNGTELRNAFEHPHSTSILPQACKAKLLALLQVESGLQLAELLH